MSPLFLLLIIVQSPAGPAPEPTPQQIFDRVRERVKQQITRSMNYTCVLTTDRSYSAQEGALHGCQPNTGFVSLQAVMHDRLRLDIADLNGQEIFSWHGSKHFSSGSVDEVVSSGPISSGAFVGYLQNIFFGKGVHIRMIRDARFQDGSYHFEYDVPLDASGYYVSTNRGGHALTAFSGAFTVDKESFELVQLTAVIANPPKKSKLCRVRSVVEYQTIPIGGTPSRIPKRFTLEINNEEHLYTLSRSEYAQCRAFTGESTVTYEVTDPAASLETTEAKEEKLPPGVSLAVTLRTTIDDGSFTGDPVEGLLARDTKLPGKAGVLTKGARVSGYISRLEDRYKPISHFIVGIHWNQLTSGSHTYLFDAQFEPGSGQANTLREIYGRRMSPDTNSNFSSGALVVPGSHLHLDQHFTGTWRTAKLREQETR